MKQNLTKYNLIMPLTPECIRILKEPFGNLIPDKNITRRRLHTILKIENIVILLFITAASIIMKFIYFNIISYHTAITYASTMVNNRIAEGTNSIAVK